jgi:hypothetical protein
VYRVVLHIYLEGIMQLRVDKPMH